MKPITRSLPESRSGSQLLGRYSPLTLAVALILVVSHGTHAAHAQEASPWLERVLLTNDNGIDDEKIVALARAFANAGVETLVVAPAQDRSGAGAYSRLMSERPRRVELTRHDFGEGVEAYALDGFPADCVLFAFQGIFRDRHPQLVVSGINGGPNLGSDWFGSGTIGAARTAAFAGVKALAVSGLDDDDAPAVVAHSNWVVRLALSGYVSALEPGQYLTVGMPRKLPEQIKGVRVAERAGFKLDA